MSIAIQAEGLGKRFILSHQPKAGYQTLRESITASFSRSRLFRGGSVTHEGFWAFQDLSFTIRHGEIVGVIGRNGAGKSTLLKVLSRITQPTQGWATLHGRVGSLLEVGTGFHPELTGRENIFLNGAILGMPRSEIARKFDEIVAFAEVEQFLDTPVKRYSSGMYLRLAFSVAAHLEPDVLVVDEVLAVGDAAFQSKCIGRMSQVAESGRTILFVSHNLSAIQLLCQRGIFLKQGRLAYDGPIQDALNAYLRSVDTSQAGQDLLDRKDRKGEGTIRLKSIDVCDAADPALPPKTGGSAKFAFYLTGVLPNTTCGFVIQDQLGQIVTGFSSTQRGPQDQVRKGAEFTCLIDPLNLLPGQYRLTTAIRSDGVVQDYLDSSLVFTVEPSAVEGRTVNQSGSGYGNVYLNHRWTIPTVG